MVTTAALHSAAVSGSTVAQRRASLPRHLRSQSGRTHSPACRCSRCVSVASAERREQVPGRKERSVVASAASTITRELEKLEEALMEPEIPMSNEVKYMLNRVNIVQESFPSATSMDDFIFKLEMALVAYGFTGDNSIAVANMCRDEITCGLKYKIEEVFPLCFNINGLGGGITCGVTGIGAGLSHSPVSVAGKARYVFFSFPHIAITSTGTVGTVGRPGQDQPNFACGALIAALGQLKAEGIEDNIKRVGTHIATDPEYSILKQRIARRMLKEDVDPEDIDLVDITKIAERQISSDLEYLISEAVNPEIADYAIVTGVQIHNWGESFDNEEPTLEFVAPTRVSVVINGERTELDLSQIPSPAPRQLRKLAGMPARDSTRRVGVYTGSTTVTEVVGPPMFNNTTERGMRKKRDQGFAFLLEKVEAKAFGFKTGAMPADDPVL
mmetsp:Transcript_31062/g.88102  ORF Transcript_31062/g.88102 Transcript_31062/m.88102 type:complete len:442 (+) Transcript_31062:581-1906(+)